MAFCGRRRACRVITIWPRSNCVAIFIDQPAPKGSSHDPAAVTEHPEEMRRIPGRALTSIRHGDVRVIVYGNARRAIGAIPPVNGEHRRESALEPFQVVRSKPFWTMKVRFECRPRLWRALRGWDPHPRWQPKRQSRRPDFSAPPGP